VTGGGGTLVFRGSTTWKTNEIAGTVSGTTTLTVDGAGLRFHVPATSLRLLSSAEYRASLVDDTVVYAWDDVKAAEYAAISMVFRVNRHESLRFSPGRSGVKALVAALGEHSVPLTHRCSTVPWGLTA
jgi:hypothetical protein